MKRQNAIFQSIYAKFSGAGVFEYSSRTRVLFETRFLSTRETLSTHTRSEVLWFQQF